MQVRIILYARSMVIPKQPQKQHIVFFNIIPSIPLVQL